MDEDRLAVTKGEFHSWLGEPAPIPDPATRAALLHRVTSSLGLPATGPAQFGRYVLASALGRGGVGVVWSAYDPELERRVAIKFLPAARRDGSRSVALERRLLEEAKTAASIVHPNVVEIYDVGFYAPPPGPHASPGRGVYVVMELLEGQTMRQWLAGEPRRWQEIARVLRDAGAGLQASHRHGVVHRDFKPANVMIGHDGRARVLDFGIALRLPHFDPLVTASSDDPPTIERVPATRSTSGTPAYMPPEQHERETADVRSDVYAFCATAFEAFTGRSAFAGASLDQLQANKSEGAPSLPSAHLGRRLRALVQRGLDPDPARRPSLERLVGALDDELARGRRRWTYAVGSTLLACTVALVAVRVGGIHRCEVPATPALELPFDATATPTRAHALLQQWWHSDQLNATALRADACRVDDVARRALVSTCLARHDARMNALVSRIAADPAVDAAAFAAAFASLPSLAHCASVRTAAMLPAERTAADDSVVIAAETELALGRPSAVDVSALGELDDTELGDAAAARAHLALGAALVERGQAAQAQAHTAAAAALAERAGEDVAVVSALNQLAAIAGDVREHHTEGLGYADTAIARVEGMHLGPRVLALALVTRARVRHIANDDRGAREDLERALELDVSDPLLRASIHAGLTGVLGEAFATDESLAHSRAADELFMAVYGPDSDRLVRGSANRALSLVVANRFDEAGEELDGLAEFAEALQSSASLAFVLYLDALVEFGREDFGQAVLAAERAVAFNEAIYGPDHPRAADSYSFLARALHANGARTEALLASGRAVDILAGYPDDRTWTGVMAQHAIMLAEAGRSRLAVALAEDAFARILTNRPRGDRWSIDAATDLVEVYMLTGRTSEALRLVDASIATADAADAGAAARAELRLQRARLLYATDREAALRQAAAARVVAASSIEAHIVMGKIDRWLAAPDVTDVWR